VNSRARQNFGFAPELDKPLNQKKANLCWWAWIFSKALEITEHMRESQ